MKGDPIVDCLHTRKRNEGAGYGHIRGENAPKSSKRTLDDYLTIGKEKNVQGCVCYEK